LVTAEQRFSVGSIAHLAEWFSPERVIQRCRAFQREEKKMIGTIISAIVVGAIVGALARLIMPGRQSIGVIMTIVLGILGSLIGSWVTYQVGYSNSNGGWAVIPFLVGVVVAIVLIGAYLAVSGRRGTGTPAH
jgi:uncharacterized membrane protein YeaQ/YmgE (transglycosylase-associated protein family)